MVEVGVKSISLISLLSLIILIIPIIIINTKLKININKKILNSIIRMSIQLSLVGVYLQYIFKINNGIINVIYLLIMIIVATISAARSSKLHLKKFLFPVFIALIIPQAVVLTFFNSFVTRLNYLLDARYLIPIGGMLLGNSLSSNIVGLNNFYSNIRKNEKEYFYTLSVGASRFQALSKYFRESILSSINPILANMATTGIVSLPGMMTGQILGGSLPVEAIKYQIAIMISIFVTIYFSVLLSLLFTVNRSFDEYEILKKDIFVY